MSKSEYNERDYATYRLQKAYETLQEMDVMLKNEFWNTAINRMYYACYYAISALLAINKINTASHSGVKQKFGQLFIKTGKFEKELGTHFSALFEKRNKGDYNDFFENDKNPAMELLPKTRDIVEKINNFIENNS